MLFLNIKSVLFNILFQTLLNEGRQMQALRKKKKKKRISINGYCSAYRMELKAGMRLG